MVGFNTLTASAGGKLVSDDGTKAAVDDGAVQALAMLKKFATAGVTDAGLSSAQEQQNALLMENGDAAFELNWPYVYAAMQQDKPDLFPHFKWTRYPSMTPGRQARVTIGGENLVISAYSQHKDEAFKAAPCLRSPKTQDYSAVNDSVPPTVASVYDAPDMALRHVEAMMAVITAGKRVQWTSSTSSWSSTRWCRCCGHCRCRSSPRPPSATATSSRKNGPNQFWE